MNLENQRNSQEQFLPPNTLRAAIPMFIGMTIGNVIFDNIVDTDFSNISAPIRAGAVTAVLYAYGKATTRN